jgi:hypothetical protein
MDLKGVGRDLFRASEIGHGSLEIAQVASYLSSKQDSVRVSRVVL